MKTHDDNPTANDDLIQIEPTFVSNPESRIAVEHSLDKALPGIPIGGTLAGFVSATVWSVLSVNGGGGSPLEFALTVAFIIIAACFSLVATAITGSLAHLGILFLNWALNGFLTRRIAIVLMAGLGGFMLPGAFVAVALARDPDVTEILIMLFTVLCFMVCCSLGALWMSNRHGVWNKLPEELQESKQVIEQIQFGTHQLLVLTTVVACILALDAVSPNHEILIFAGIYCLLQASMLLADLFVFRQVKQRLHQS